MSVWDISKTKEFKDAMKKLTFWNKKMKSCNLDEIVKIREDMKRYFSRMRKKNPVLFEVLAFERKELVESMIHRVTGDKVSIY